MITCYIALLPWVTQAQEYFTILDVADELMTLAANYVAIHCRDSGHLTHDAACRVQTYHCPNTVVLVVVIVVVVVVVVVIKKHS